ncbi:YbjN domain-containing protein [Novosphingobium sp.]|uniref:YbjN domain-containing protein n=1 Tax=Novosphingobium sp. TaxID=1874826 RepID=UPI0038B8FC72
MPATAYADSISASRPEGIVAALQAAGHEAALTHDESGDPLIQASIGGWSTQVVFYDCNEITHESCQSLQFATGFMPERPFGAAQAAAFVRDNRFGAVSVADDKTVSVTWDVITGSGIDPQVFGLVLKSYRLALDTIGGQVFAPGHQPRLASASR